MSSFRTITLTQKGSYVYWGEHYALGFFNTPPFSLTNLKFSLTLIASSVASSLTAMPVYYFTIRLK